MSTAKRNLHWAARILSIVCGLGFVVFFGAEAIASVFGTPSNGTGGSLLTSVDYVLLALDVVMIVGFVIAWWRPVVGGALILASIVFPIAVSLQRSGLDPTSIFYTVMFYGVVALTGVLNLIDGLWGNAPSKHAPHTPVA